MVRKIREAIPDVALRTSLIVGFPGETEEDFEKLKLFVRDIQFDRLGVFAYSKEDDTPAARLPDQVPDDVKEYRANAIMEIQREISNLRGGRRVGQEIDVLIERYDGRSDVYIGRSQFDAPKLMAKCSYRMESLNIGELARVRITHSYEFDLSGEVIA